MVINWKKRTKVYFCLNRNIVIQMFDARHLDWMWFSSETNVKSTMQTLINVSNMLYAEGFIKKLNSKDDDESGMRSAHQWNKKPQQFNKDNKKHVFYAHWWLSKNESECLSFNAHKNIERQIKARWIAFDIRYMKSVTLSATNWCKKVHSQNITRTNIEQFFNNLENIFITSLIMMQSFARTFSLICYF